MIGKCHHLREEENEGRMRKAEETMPMLCVKIPTKQRYREEKEGYL